MEIIFTRLAQERNNFYNMYVESNFMQEER